MEFSSFRSWRRRPHSLVCGQEVRKWKTRRWFIARGIVAKCGVWRLTRLGIVSKPSHSVRPFMLNGGIPRCAHSKLRGYRAQIWSHFEVWTVCTTSKATVLRAPIAWFEIWPNQANLKGYILAILTECRNHLSLRHTPIIDLFRVQWFELIINMGKNCENVPSQIYQLGQISNHATSARKTAAFDV